MLVLWWPNQPATKAKQSSARNQVPISQFSSEQQQMHMHEPSVNSSNFGHQTSMKQGTAMEFPKLHLEPSPPLESSEEGEVFGVILSRSRSVSSASTVALRAEKQSSALENTLKRAFSMKRSRSTSCVATGGRGGYYKIFHHFDDPDPDPIALHEFHNVAIKSRKKRSSKIFEACKRLIGF
ncbi:hypothetical protein GQ457_11G011280 [Hibiscus cannabinus]